jgi:hypothetical protein
MRSHRVTEENFVGFTLIHLCVTNVTNVTNITKVTNVRFSHSHIRATETGKTPDGRLAPHPWPTSIYGVQPAAREEADRYS